MRSTREENYGAVQNDGMPPRPKLPCAVAYRGQRIRGKRRLEGGPDNLNAHPPAHLPTCTHSKLLSRRANCQYVCTERYEPGGWLANWLPYLIIRGGPQHTPKLFDQSPGRTPRPLVLLSVLSEHLSSSVFLPLSCPRWSQTRACHSHHLFLVVLSTRDRQADLCCIMHS